MEMLLYQSTQFRDVKKILDRAHGFAGLLTAGDAVKSADSRNPVGAKL